MGKGRMEVTISAEMKGQVDGAHAPVNQATRCYELEFEPTVAVGLAGLWLVDGDDGCSWEVEVGMRMNAMVG